MATDFKLSASLRGHEEDVRAIAYPNKQTLFSASRDNTVRKWTLTSPKPPVYDDTIALQGSHWFNGIAYAPPSKEHPDGLVAAGGRETFVFVKQVGKPPEEDPHRLLIGHAGNITCLAFSQDARKIVSGGWDSQVFVWDVEEGSVSAELTGHQGPIWGVMVYDERFVLTACADKTIRLFDINGKSLKTIKGHTDVVRCFCKLPEGHWSGAAFASAGNDEIIRLWTLDGTAMGELEGHSAYIYNLAITPDGDIVSSSEDRTVKVWRNGQCIQTITHPAVSIWAVTVCPETGDITSGASDNTIRIFTRDPERQDTEAIAAFDETNRMYAIPQETASQGQPFQKENLPGPEALQTQTGQKDGQQLFIRENDGSVTAHLWSSSASTWNLIGTVVSGEGTGAQKREYNGKEYDYVFDIDIEDGKPPLKLPYNVTESPWDAARRFLEANELPMTYYEQVANWISDNTKGTRIGQDSGAGSGAAPAPQSQDPWGTGARYRPGDAGSASTSGQRKLPQQSFLDIVEGNVQNAVTKISDSSQQLLDSGKITKDCSLTSDDAQILQALVEQMTKSPKDPHPTNEQIAALMKVASGWPTASRVPGIALLARLAVSPAFIFSTSAGEKTIIDTAASASLLEPKQATANNAVHALRLLVNLFASDGGRMIVDGKFDDTLNLVRPLASEPESPAQFKALSTLYLNYAVLLTSNAPASTASKTKEARAKTLLTDIAVLLECESPHAGDSEGLFRTLCALGTLFTLGEDFRREMKMGAAGTLHFVGTKAGANEARVKEVVQEIRDELR